MTVGCIIFYFMGYKDVDFTGLILVCYFHVAPEPDIGCHSVILGEFSLQHSITVECVIHYELSEGNATYHLHCNMNL